METETDTFLAEMLPRQVAAERAIHDGDAGPRMALWSRRDPVTLFGASLTGVGWEHLSADFATVASWFSDAESYDVEVVAAGASCDLAYLVCYERNTVKVNGEVRTYTLRATHVYRREDGDWKIVHRHADPLPAESSTRAFA